MTGLRLAKLPDRKPVKLAFNASPELHKRLRDYAGAYAETYGVEEPLDELVPAMLASFLDADRGFARGRK